MPTASFRLRSRAEHRALRRRAARLERTALAVAEGILPRDLLDADVRGLQAALARHLAWEERSVRVELDDAAPAARRDLTRACEAHRELEDVIALCASGPGCRRVPTAVAAGRALDLAALVRDELRAEDAFLGFVASDGAGPRSSA